jgi:hypothetical protein
MNSAPSMGGILKSVTTRLLMHIAPAAQDMR